MRRSSRLIAVVFVVVASLPLTAQRKEPTCNLSTSAGQTTFRMGERISLTLSLTGPDDNEYVVDNASYDRSGRLTIDTFQALPDSGWSDPLAQYFSLGFMGGGLRSSQPLSSKPAVFKADLNEQIRFDQPGTYTITATSHRVGTRRKNSYSQEPYGPLVCNPVQIHVVAATPEWQAQKLSAINAVLATLRKPVPFGSLPEEQAAAIADLRFLNSAAAIQTLTTYLREDAVEGSGQLTWAAALGLAGVPGPLRDLALKSMAERLEDPAFPVSSVFLRIMSLLEAAPNDGLEQLIASKNARRAEVWQLAYRSLLRKQGPARSLTADTLLSEHHEAPLEASSAIAGVLVATFNSLPADRQTAELRYNWDDFRSLPILPALKAIFEQEQPASPRGFYSAADRNVIALQRWFELEPSSALRELNLQLASAKPEFPMDAIRNLPGGPQPQFESTWAQELLESEDYQREALLGALLVHFGTGEAIAAVGSKVGARVGNWACEPQATSLAYLVKFDTGAASVAIHRAMSSTEATRCYTTLFSDVSRFAHGPALNEAAVSSLANPDPRASADAAAYLKSYGTEAAKQPLLKRYREWHEGWAGKPEEVNPATESGYPQSQLGQNLAEALIANQDWIADAALIKEVLSDCVGEQMCRQLQIVASKASSPLQIFVTGILDGKQFVVAQFEPKDMALLKAKIGQYPVGTRFTLVPSSPQDSDQRKLEQEVSDVLSNHGMVLEGAKSDTGIRSH